MLIDNITKSVSEMTDDELYERIKELRSARRVTTKIPRGTRPVKTPSLGDMQDLLATMSKDAMASLLAELED